ncbi:8-amino-7-oxononanoate synthase, partial [Streptomyces sp. DvalAA-14]
MNSATSVNGPQAARPAGPADPFGWIAEQDRTRRASGLRRELRPRAAESELLDLAGNDYLGLTRHPEVTRAGADACLRWGAGATGSRLVTGSTALHAELEAALADFTGFEAALVFASGYAANLAAVTALTGPGTLLVSDAANHASLIDGCRLSRATTEVVRHADPDAVRKALDGHRGAAVVVSDTVFSVDGDAAPLAALADACREHGAALLMDDAHGLGVLGEEGRGAANAAGLAGAPDVVCTATLSKALGAAGGCGARSGGRHRASGQRGPHLHLRHRPGPGGGRRRARSAAAAAPRTVARGEVTGGRPRLPPAADRGRPGRGRARRLRGVGAR